MGRVGAVFNNPVHVPDFYIFCFGRQSRVANPQEALSRDGLGVLHGVLIKKRRKHSTFSIGKKTFSLLLSTHTQQLMYCARHLAQARLNSLAIYARTNVTQQVVVFWRNNQFPSLLFSAVANVPETAGARGRRFLLVPRWRNLFGWSILFKFHFLISLLFGSLPHIQDE